MTINRICHYTNLDALALILKTRSIRFTRLDHVDDVREAQEHLGINFGMRFFVSCWTTDLEESIPQWNMYSDKMRGVRIELPAYPFKSTPLRPPPHWTGIEFAGEIPSPIPFEALWGDSYLVMPLFFEPKNFAGEMQYVDDVEAVYKQAVHREINAADGTQSFRITDLHLLPRNKSKHWSFQNEYRFSLFIIPSPPMPQEGPGHLPFIDNLATYVPQAFLTNVDPGIAFFDLSLDENALEQLVVRTGPLASPGVLATVEAILSTYAPKARLERSALEGQIRTKK